MSMRAFSLFLSVPVPSLPLPSLTSAWSRTSASFSPDPSSKWTLASSPLSEVVEVEKKRTTRDEVDVEKKRTTRKEVEVEVDDDAADRRQRLAHVIASRLSAIFFKAALAIPSRWPLCVVSSPWPVCLELSPAADDAAKRGKKWKNKIKSNSHSRSHYLIFFFFSASMLAENSPFGLGLSPEPLLPSPAAAIPVHQHDPNAIPPPHAQPAVAAPTATTTATTEGALVLLVARSRVGRVIGRAGDTIKSLQTYSGAAIQIDQSCDPTRVVLAGADGAVRLAASMVG
jgi:predicted RNA-binding protein YlqC (UPF0109 family)